MIKITDATLAGAWADYFGKGPTKKNLKRFIDAIETDITEWLKDNARHCAETMTEKESEKAFEYDK